MTGKSRDAGFAGNRGLEIGLAFRESSLGTSGDSVAATSQTGLFVIQLFLSMEQRVASRVASILMAPAWQGQSLHRTTKSGLVAVSRSFHLSVPLPSNQHAPRYPPR